LRWDSPHPIYVNAPHKDVHYRVIAQQIAARAWAAANGFVIVALVDIARTVASDHWRLRARLGGTPMTRRP
jgi:hypothetical protein